MKKVVIVSLLVLAVTAILVYGLTLVGSGKWSGVDETVVEKYAEAAGHPAWKPLINTDQGDMLLFFFLIAGVCGGFVAGYCFHEMFSTPANDDKIRELWAQHD